MNFRTALYKGEPVLTWWQGRAARGLGIGFHVIVDSTYREVARLPAGAGRQSDLHEFMLTPRGTAIVTSYEVRTMNLSRVGGPSSGKVIGGIVQEIAIPSARVLFEWRSLDHVAIDEAYNAYNGHAYDCFHINSVDVDADGNLLVSARNTWAVYKLDSETGRVIWRLGGKRSDFQMGPGTRFAWQHDARHHEEGRLISIFDNSAAPPGGTAVPRAADRARSTESGVPGSCASTHIPDGCSRPSWAMRRGCRTAISSSVGAGCRTSRSSAATAASISTRGCPARDRTTGRFGSHGRAARTGRRDSSRTPPPGGGGCT